MRLIASAAILIGQPEEVSTIPQTPSQGLSENWVSYSSKISGWSEFSLAHGMKLVLKI